MKPGAVGNGPFRRIGRITEVVFGGFKLTSVDATEESCGVWHFTSAFIGEIPSDQIEWDQ
ncbi:hypothetical protein [Stieleria varia]|uniref:Uncharacterized protein n=1 Tax=Stieleria varia TaxID=2528005 RepID=A0A5C6BAD2_9BACT|nr:hypothetical protein [Stieleria varia]TWU08239.1 hypothetical protein Pla52n_08210 [Stieleria varia]